MMKGPGGTEKAPITKVEVVPPSKVTVTDLVAIDEISQPGSRQRNQRTGRSRFISKRGD